VRSRSIKSRGGKFHNYFGKFSQRSREVFLGCDVGVRSRLSPCPPCYSPLLSPDIKNAAAIKPRRMIEKGGGTKVVMMAPIMPTRKNAMTYFIKGCVDCFVFTARRSGRVLLRGGSCFVCGCLS
jgi:hypothetical protein